jgi:hypothetical protein
VKEIDKNKRREYWREKSEQLLDSEERRPVDEQAGQ